MKKSWFTITNKTETECEVCIYDEIGMWGISAKDFLNELKAAGSRKIKLRINSPGGEVFDGLAIYNRLSEHAPGVEVCIDGIAASMASVIAMVGSPIKMASNALLMIHDPSGLCIGNSEDMRDLADMLDKVKGCLIGAYTKKTGKTDEEISAMMRDETWLNASECESMGFIDEITGAMKMAASFNRLKQDPKLEAREKSLAASKKEIDIEKSSMEQPPIKVMTDPEKTPAEIEIEAIQAKANADALAARENKITADAVTAERKRVTDIQAWSKEVSDARKIDLGKVTASHIADGKTLQDFKEHVLMNEFKSKPLATVTDKTGAQGLTMTRAEFDVMDNAKKSEFLKNGGKLKDN